MTSNYKPAAPASPLVISTRPLRKVRYTVKRTPGCITTQWGVFRGKELVEGGWLHRGAADHACLVYQRQVDLLPAHKAPIVGEIAFYGNHDIGAGLIANTIDGHMWSDSADPIPTRSFTDALHLGLDYLRRCFPGVQSGAVLLHHQGGHHHFSTYVDLHMVGNYGDIINLPRVPTPSYTIDMRTGVALKYDTPTGF